MLRILGRVTSINVRKVLWVADELGLAYSREDWGLPIRDPSVPEFLKLNPNAQVPVIIDEGFSLWESSAIMRYLAEQHGAGLLPAEAKARAVMEQWLGWQSSEMSSAWGYAFRALVWRAPGFDDKVSIASSIARWSTKMAILEGLFNDGRPFVVGDAFTLADIVIGLTAHRWFSTPFDKPSLPAVERFYLAIKTRPASAPHLGEATP